MQSIPVTLTTQDYITPVSTAVNALFSMSNTPFLKAGNQLFTWLAVITLVIYGLKWALSSAARHHAEFDFPALVHFFAVFLVGEALLTYYNTPLPWTSSSVHQLLPDTGRQFAATIDISTLNAFLIQVKKLLAGQQLPSLYNLQQVILFYLILVNMIIIEGLFFALNILAFIMIGIGSLVGPLFIPWLIVPRVSFLFWNWVQFMLKYSFYQVVAAALTNIWANLLLNFLTNSFNGHYSLAMFLAMLVPLGLLNIGFIVCIWKSGSIVSDLFTGAASAGSNLAGSVSGALRGAFA